MNRPPILLLVAALIVAGVAGGVLWHLGDLKSQRSATIASDD